MVLNTLKKVHADMIMGSRYLRGYFCTLPDFLNIGVQKGGTTSLHEYLAQHPNVAMPKRGKELHYFDMFYSRNLVWYCWFFPSVFEQYYRKQVKREPLVAGECTPYYLLHPHAAMRVKQTLPNAKLIALLRDPVKRAYSNYSHNVKKKREPLTFEEALDQEPERIRGEREKLEADPYYISLNYQLYSYALQGIYVDQLQHWMKYFPREQFLILDSETFFTNPRAALKQVYQFLEIPEHVLPDYPIFNSQSEGEILPETQARLAEYFRPHNERLYELLGVDFGW